MFYKIGLSITFAVKGNKNKKLILKTKSPRNVEKLTNDYFLIPQFPPTDKINNFSLNLMSHNCYNHILNVYYYFNINIMNEISFEWREILLFFFFGNYFKTNFFNYFFYFFYNFFFIFSFNFFYFYLFFKQKRREKEILGVRLPSSSSSSSWSLHVVGIILASAEFKVNSKKFSHHLLCTLRTIETTESRWVE